MSITSRHPSLYQINTRVWLHELAQSLGRAATFDDLADPVLDDWAGRGFQWIWFLGVWQTGDAGPAISRSQPEWRQEYQRILPDLRDEDICGSPFAIVDYAVHRDFGGNDALVRLRERLRKRGLKLLLDFVPNHVALDHPLTDTHPEFFMAGSNDDLAREPQNYCLRETAHGACILAYGRDPYFAGWPDTLQLNYRHAGLRKAMIAQLARVAVLCDGVRCDMAMLLLPDVFLRTWGDRSTPRDGSVAVDSSFWPEATACIRSLHPAFLFMAEVYWDLEWVLQQQGFDYTYDKRLYDRLHGHEVSGVSGHLHADFAFQRKSVRFLENHDEPRAAAAFPNGSHQAAAIVSFLVPGLRFFHEGQFEGRKVRVSVHLARRPTEPIDPVLADFYRKLLEVLKRPDVRDGAWQQLDCRPAWDGNPTFDHFLAMTWNGPNGERLLIVVNDGPTWGQGYVGLPYNDLQNRTFLLRDLMGAARYERDGNDLAGRGLYLDMPGWGYHVFEIRGL